MHRPEWVKEYQIKSSQIKAYAFLSNILGGRVEKRRKSEATSGDQNGGISSNYDRQICSFQFLFGGFFSDIWVATGNITSISSQL